MKIYLEDKDYQHMKQLSEIKGNINITDIFAEQLRLHLSLNKRNTANSDINALRTPPEIENIKNYKNKV
jgi:hypothetical protein